MVSHSRAGRLGFVNPTSAESIRTVYDRLQAHIGRPGRIAELAGVAPIQSLPKSSPRGRSRLVSGSSGDPQYFLMGACCSPANNFGEYRQERPSSISEAVASPSQGRGQSR